MRISGFTQFTRWFVRTLHDDEVAAALDTLRRHERRKQLRPPTLSPDRHRAQLEALWNRRHWDVLVSRYFAEKHGALLKLVRSIAGDELREPSQQLQDQFGLRDLILACVLSGDEHKAQIGYQLASQYGDRLLRARIGNSSEPESVGITPGVAAASDSDDSAASDGGSDCPEPDRRGDAQHGSEYWERQLQGVIRAIRSGRLTAPADRLAPVMAELLDAWQTYESRSRTLDDIATVLSSLTAEFRDMLNHWGLIGHEALEPTRYASLSRETLREALAALQRAHELCQEGRLLKERVLSAQQAELEELVSKLKALGAQARECLDRKPESARGSVFPDTGHTSRLEALKDHRESAQLELDDVGVTAGDLAATTCAPESLEDEGEPESPDAGPEGCSAEDEEAFANAQALPSSAPSQGREVPGDEEQRLGSQAEQESGAKESTSDRELATAANQSAEQEGLDSSVRELPGEEPLQKLGKCPQFRVDTEPAEIARAILEDTRGSERAGMLQALIWSLIRERRAGLAYHFARVLEADFPDSDPKIPSWLIRAMALGPHVQGPSGEIAEILKHDFDRFDVSCFAGDDRWNQAVSLLLVAAAVRAAVLVPTTNPAAILADLRVGEGLSELFHYCQDLAESSVWRKPLDGSALRTLRDQSAWEAEKRSIVLEAEQWFTQGRMLSVQYAPATQVWRQWLEPEGPIHKLLNPVRHDESDRCAEVASEAERFEEDSEVEQLVQKTRARLVGRRRVEPITGPALQVLKRRVRQAVSLARRWIALYEGQSQARLAQIQQLAEQLRTDLERWYPRILEELANVEGKHSTSLAIRAAVTCCRRALQTTRDVFDPAIPLPTQEPDVRHLLHAELLHAHALELDENWEPTGHGYEALAVPLLTVLATGRRSWQESFDTRCEQRDHDASLRIIEYLESNPSDGIDTATLRRIRNEQLNECRSALRRDLLFTKQVVEQAVLKDQVSDSERAAHQITLSAIENEVPTATRFGPDHEALRAIQKSIEGGLERRVEDARRYMQKAGIDETHPAYDRITAVLAQGDVLTAHEYIDMVRKGEPLPEAEASRRVFDSFFPDGLRRMEEFLERVEVRDVVARIRARKREALVEIDVRAPAGKQTDEAASRLETWFRLKERRRLDAGCSEVLEVLAHLGFTPLKATPQQGRAQHNWSWVDVEVEPLGHRNQCPVPAFGSMANGRYKVLCVWDRPPEEDVVHFVGDKPYSSPILVFYFGRMSEAKRRNLGRLCWSHRRTLLVVDDILMYYLCGVRGARLPVFFECTLPFTFVEPYSIRSSWVPPEMLYGRQRERDEIIRETGCCFIYGGRQLGKTALLRDVQHRFHQPDGPRRALWLDLKVRGIGRERPVEEIWSLLCQELKGIGVVPSHVPVHVTPDTLLRHVQNWIESDRERRLLLLLDEADLFLEADSTSQYRHTDRLKGLMDATVGRFKVVFAGLHNVLRAASERNHPLGHFGESLCIGPLMEGSERREARELIIRPLESLGFRFEQREEGTDLVTRILSQANYYPSLIQIYCRHLLAYMQSEARRVRFRQQDSPPYVITAQDIEHVYGAEEVRILVRDRFMLTLQLDSRYEFLAYLIAYYSLEHKERMAEGFTVSWIRQEALSWWPEGFPMRATQSHDEHFRILLDEMSGLGVLRDDIGDGRYGLRNPNVLLLMGNKEEILEQLIRTREPALEYKPRTFRRSLPPLAGRAQVASRSPLTVSQEIEIGGPENGVAILFGCPAAGLDDVERSLESLVGPEHLVRVSDILERRQFVTKLGDVSERRKRGPTVLLVPSDCPWSDVWVQDAVDWTRRRKSPISPLKVVFVADPRITWQLIAQGDNGLEGLRRQGVRFLHLEPWHEAALRHWLDDCNVRQDRELREQIRGVTGLWPLLLMRLYARAEERPHQWLQAIEQVGRELHEAATVEDLAARFGLDRPEVRKVMRVLAELGDATLEDVAELVDDLAVDVVNQVITWAGLLNLAGQRGEGLQCEPIVATLVRQFRDEVP